MSTNSTASEALPLAFPSGATVVLDANASRDDWHAIRKTGLGGSDLPAICGLNKWTSPLEVWFRKTGQPVPRREDPILDEAAENGHDLEPFVASRFTKKTGLPAHRNPGTLRRPDIPWAIVNLDRTTEENGLPGVVELKTRSSYALQDWLDEVPIDTQIQVQWQLAVTGWTFGYAACLIGGQRTIVHRIDRDEQMIADLLNIAAEFWGWVEAGTQPPVDGSVATGELLDRLHANPTEKDVVADVGEVERWLNIRRTAKEQAAAADIAITDADNHLKAIAGNGTDVYIRGELAYTWRPRKGQVSWKKAALEADPDIDPEPYRGKPTRTLNIVMENL
ncbi:YqaJ viral recombinase family protein [Streptomyces sp. NBC_01373]|uniref:YqaJ viral recombinase family nuclease n=1 Tax=Streptomyces sp. NBC_01373 TaxID=2903843 RepID=UPI00224FDEAD|nr:YqaJ viral recombinase family protein [Streptomyces sp. NBC_01373]MCX4697048.1 YqaJ viral recombinase family protein [Streptomyces sp. NBC_01373]MCX4707027.1 YqaJ viral recombinase family protein [Streptomyces sp. NBC_01373]